MRTLTKQLIAGAAFAMLAFAPAAYAQSAAPAGGISIAATKIAVVNVPMIMRDSTAAKSAQEQLTAKQKAYQSEISKKEEALQKEKIELNKQSTALSKEAFEEKVKAYNIKAKALEQEVITKKRTFDGAFERSQGQIQKSVSDIIAELAKEKGFAVALANTLIMYADNSLDITPEVISRLNQRLPKIDVKFDAPAKQ